MKIAVRMDDISPGMNRENFERFYNLLKECGIRPLLGVVPYNQDTTLNVQTPLEDAAFWQWIRQLQQEGCSIAMHGYSHVYTTSGGGIFPLNNFSEFAGLTYEDQEKKILKGQEILRKNGIRTDLFMAPAHSYDKNTLCALRNAGFCKVTDGFGTIPYQYRDITFYPISFRQRWSLGRKRGYTTFVVHSNSMTDQDFHRWQDNLQKSEFTEWISYEELFDVDAKHRTMWGMLKEKVMASCKHILVKV